MHDRSERLPILLDAIDKQVPARRYRGGGSGRIAIALPDLLRNVGASRGLQIPSRRTLSPYWKPRHARGFLSLFVYRQVPNQAASPAFAFAARH